MLRVNIFAFLILLSATQLYAVEDRAAPGVIVVKVPLAADDSELPAQTELLIYEMDVKFLADGQVDLEQIKQYTAANKEAPTVLKVSEIAIDEQTEVPQSVMQELEKAQQEQEEMQDPSFLSVQTPPIYWRVWTPYGVYPYAGFYGYGYYPNYGYGYYPPYYGRYRYYDGRYHYRYRPAYRLPYRYGPANYYYYYHRPGDRW